MGEYWFGKQSFFEPMGLVLFLLGFIYIIYKLILRTSFYHFAILFSDRGDLAKTVFNIITKAETTFSGSADQSINLKLPIISN